MVEEEKVVSTAPVGWMTVETEPGLLVGRGAVILGRLEVVGVDWEGRLG